MQTLILETLINIIIDVIVFVIIYYYICFVRKIYKKVAANRWLI